MTNMFVVNFNANDWLSSPDRILIDSRKSQTDRWGVLSTSTGHDDSATHSRRVDVDSIPHKTAALDNTLTPDNDLALTLDLTLALSLSLDLTLALDNDLTLSLDNVFYFFSTMISP